MKSIPSIQLDIASFIVNKFLKFYVKNDSEPVRLFNNWEEAGAGELR